MSDTDMVERVELAMDSTPYISYRRNKARPMDQFEVYRERHQGPIDDDTFEILGVYSTAEEAETVAVARRRHARARAAIAAMRTPTAAMIWAGDEAQTETEGPDQGFQVAMSSAVPWRAMIDAALAEPDGR